MEAPIFVMKFQLLFTNHDNTIDLFSMLSYLSLSLCGRELGRWYEIPQLITFNEGELMSSKFQNEN